MTRGRRRRLRSARFRWHDRQRQYPAPSGSRRPTRRSAATAGLSGRHAPADDHSVFGNRPRAFAPRALLRWAPRSRVNANSSGLRDEALCQGTPRGSACAGRRRLFGGIRHRALQRRELGRDQRLCHGLSLADATTAQGGHPLSDGRSGLRRWFHELLGQGDVSARQPLGDHLRHRLSRRRSVLLARFCVRRMTHALHLARALVAWVPKTLYLRERRRARPSPRSVRRAPRRAGRSRSRP